MKTRKMLLIFLIVLAVAMFASFALGQQTGRKQVKPQTDAINHYYSTGASGKWVKGCSDCDGDSCNMGVGNVGPKCTYHWEKDR